MITAETLVDYARDVAEGNGERVLRILRAQGKEVVAQEGRCYTIRSDGFVCGLPLGGSLVDALPAVCWALLGPLWVFVVGKEFDRAQKLISAEYKAKRQEAYPERFRREEKGS